jgi:hypothetical protein
MISFKGLRRRLTGVLVGVLAVFCVTTLSAVPAQATLSAPIPFDFQLTGSWNGTIILVGRASGLLQFDDSNTFFHLEATICRQSSYTAVTLYVYVNGGYYTQFSASDCTGVNNNFPYAGIIMNITLRFDGLFFNGQTAFPKSKSGFYDNPFN